MNLLALPVLVIAIYLEWKLIVLISVMNKRRQKPKKYYPKAGK